MIDHSKIQLIETDSPGYRVRTAFNASSNDCTFYMYSTGYANTEGTKLTRSHSNIFVHCNVCNSFKVAVKQLSDVKFSTLNVAGNSIARFNNQWDQRRLNLYTWQILSIAHEVCPIVSITSGGQTGGDWAGLVVGIALGIPIIGRFPRKFKRRNRQGSDWTSTRNEIETELEQDVDKLLIDTSTCIEL